MNFEETKFWVSGLFPGKPQISEYVAELPGSGRHGQEHDSVPPWVAEFSFYDRPDGQANERRPETAAATVESGRNYCGLTDAAKTDIHVRLFSVTYADFPVVTIVAATGALMEEEPEFLSPIPGRAIPNAVRLAADQVAEVGESSSNTTFTMAHMLCTVPYMWNDGVPNVSEIPGKISLHEGDVESPQGRMTTMTQLVPITDTELVFYEQQGPQALMQKLTEVDADLRDRCHESVVPQEGSN